ILRRPSRPALKGLRRIFGLFPFSSCPFSGPFYLHRVPPLQQASGAQPSLRFRSASRWPPWIRPLVISQGGIFPREQERPGSAASSFEWGGLRPPNPPVSAT